MEFDIKTHKYDKGIERYSLVMIIDGKRFVCERQYKSPQSLKNQEKRILEASPIMREKK